MRTLLLYLCAASAGLALLAQATAQTAASPAPPKAKPVNLDTDPHLVGWWQFEETSGTTAADSARPGHAGTLEGGLSFATHCAPGRVGKALRLEGNEGSVRIDGFKGVTGTQARTVAAWIKTPAGEGELATWGADEPGQRWLFTHIRGRVGVTPRGGYYYMREGTADDAWHHVAVVMKTGTPPNLHDHVQLFRDGELAVVDDIGLLDLVPFETGDKLDVRLGRRFKGLLDDVRIYDRALSEDEIAALFHQAPALASPPAGNR